MGRRYLQYSSTYVDVCGRTAWKNSTYGDTKLYSATVYFVLKSRSSKMGDAMESMLKLSTCQSFRTHCKDLIVMIKKPYAWSNFATKLERIETLLIYFPDFKISHIPWAHNRISDSLVRTVRTFHKKFHFVYCSIPIWLSRSPQFWVIE